MNTSINLAELTHQNLELIMRDPAAQARLRSVARHQLARRQLHGHDADELLNSAMLAVLRGAESQRKGRHPRPADVDNPHAFERWLNGILESLAAVERVAADRLADRVAGLPTLTATPVDGVVHRVDARLRLERLQVRLRQVFADRPERLRLVEEWVANGLGEFPGKPHEAHALRQTARQLLHAELAGPELE